MLSTIKLFHDMRHGIAGGITRKFASKQHSGSKHEHSSQCWKLRSPRFLVRWMWFSDDRLPYAYSFSSSLSFCSFCKFNAPWKCKLWAIYRLHWKGLQSPGYPRARQDLLLVLDTIQQHRTNPPRKLKVTLAAFKHNLVSLTLNKLHLNQIF